MFLNLASLRELGKRLLARSVTVLALTFHNAKPGSTNSEAVHEPGRTTLPRALISVYDKSGVADLASRLHAAGIEILSTGGTARVLRDSGVAVVDVSTMTGFPEMLDGRVKTLHPFVHAGLLARRDLPEHMQTLEDFDISTIDILICNLYPFESVIGQAGVTDEHAIENIDIGGPAMIRSAAKNHAGVVVVVDPGSYAQIVSQIETGGLESISPAERRRLASDAFGHVSRYDSLVAGYLRAEDAFPAELTIGGRILHETRYGENPHQRAAIYGLTSARSSGGVATWKVEAGGELSYNNYLDASAALMTAMAFETPTVVIVKHTLPCGVGTSTDLAEAFRLALSGDPVSAFGGVLACNRCVTSAMAEAIGRLRLDVMIAPGYEPDAIDLLKKRRNLRVIRVGQTVIGDAWDVRSVPGGFLIQEADMLPVDSRKWSVVTDRSPSTDEMQALEFAWRVVPYVKSNAIVLAKSDRLVGMGAGQPNRVESVRIAAKVAGDNALGSAMASDAFFPFADGIEAAAAAGVTAIVQPGGSVRDDECIAAANASGITMLFSSTRHFRH
jgi:phosphoribosylaminoimidazolecarboxamide formyltransferase / IMP cyclohydrolase